MKIEYDPSKNQRNIEVRGLSFELVHNFDFDNVIETVQIVDGETRYFVLGYIHQRLYALVYTLRGDALRVISLRKANPREVKRYEQIRQQHQP